MFDKILIKSGSNQSEHFLSIADLVDMMFYYKEVHIVISQFELKQLLSVFGEDVLYELIVSKRLYIHPCDQHIGVVRQSELESLGLFGSNSSSIEEILFKFHKKFTVDRKNSEQFAKRFSEVLNIYRYPSNLQDSLYSDVENDDLLSRSAREFIRRYYPDYSSIDKIKIKAELVQSSIMNFYHIDGNLRLDELNSLHSYYKYDGDFSYTTVLMSIGETHMDCYLASQMEAELIANQRWGGVYKLRMNECINRAEGSLTNIDHFQEMAANNYLSPGQSFVKGLISPEDLLKDLNCRDSVKFREWLSSLPEGQPITEEIFKEIQHQNSDKIWVKMVRCISQIVTGVFNPLVGGIHSFLDGFVGDKLINGWKPSYFVSKVLNKDAFIKQY